MGMDRIKSCYGHPRLTDRPLVLYPAGEYGREMLRKLRLMGVEPAAFCDASQTKIGKSIDGIQVQSLECLLETYGAAGAKYLINSIYCYSQIEARLTAKGVPSECILSPDIDSYCETGVIERPLHLSAEDHRKLKECYLDLLCFFHKVCEKYNIPYYLTSGTLLGAVRSRGFIPWDDDVDIAMLRKDYKRFYRVVEKELGHRYAVQELLSRKNLGLRDSLFRLFGSDQEMMIMIDTFPVDYVFAYPNTLNLIQERVSLYLYRLAMKCRWYLREDRLSRWGRMFRILAGAVNQMCNCWDTGWLHYFIPDSPNMYGDRVYDKSWIGKRVLVEFEGFQFYGPEKYDQVLRQMFGSDYMELPPQDKRILPHAISEIRFPKGERTEEKNG